MPVGYREAWDVLGQGALPEGDVKSLEVEDCCARERRSVKVNRWE